MNHALKTGVATLVLGTALIATSAFAQNAAPAAQGASADKPAEDTGPTIVVTGSITKNPAAATASPLVVLSAETLTSRGINTVSGALQSIAANNAGTLPSSWSSHGFATGASAPSLRGLNNGYTLTTFDGLRSALFPMADDGVRNFVDLNTIPDSIVDRVDVLQDGASSTYGADAVAGVVNVIVKKQIVGLHVNASGGIAQRGYGAEGRFDATWGKGRLEEDGYNFYVNGEYQHNAAVYMNQRGGKWGTADQSNICDAVGSCLKNGVINGIQGNGAYTAFDAAKSATTVGFARAYDISGTTAATAANSASRWSQISPATGCQGLTAKALTPTQQGTISPSTVCQQDLTKQYGMYSPEITRIGANARLTANLTDRIQVYGMFNFAEAKTFSSGNPRNFSSKTASGTTDLGTLLLPVYVCPTGVGNKNPSLTGCNAGNGTLNPNNPYAANGQYAQVSGLYDRPIESYTDAKTYRFSGGISGDFGKGWNFDLEGTTSWVNMDLTQLNYINAQHLLNLIATGGYNFGDQSQNTQAARDYLAPAVHTVNRSKLTQFQGTINRDFFKLPGGDLNIAVGAAYRFESLNQPSANPDDAYYGINAVSTAGSRRVYSGFYEVTAPILSSLKLKADGRYDSYSSGQSNFSPKFEAQFQPIKELKFRGTFSKGFRIPSFNQSNGLPTTGYSTKTITCSNPIYTAFCAAHASAPTYFNGVGTDPNDPTKGTGTYSLGVTAVGNPNLRPEKSTSFTVGTVFTPNRHLTLTADFWHTKITDIIVSVSDPTPALTQYFTNNGVVNIPGISVTQNSADAQNPNALPLIRTIVASYTNADSEVASGIDVSASARYDLGHGVRFTSQFNGSWLTKLALTSGGTEFRYDGTLGPCETTSCSGAPHFRAVWANTFDFGPEQKYSLTLTGNYTSGYSETATDDGDTYKVCEVGAGDVVGYSGTNNPVICNTHPTFTIDLHTQAKVNKNFLIYMDVKNLLDSGPVYDPAAGYQLYQFNPAWGDSNYIGRFFRVGAKIDF
ncbi:TonB-dependent receptor plug domain-containing protein [Novosphingobium rosa]|uniref:TonB-dependent receptor plug domain-containing protein n=1 Tax=Novosphingobium rosa TaxID=76978 RepID=UPI0008304E42|nr:TonB-dependent receptor [Novosphingobium rosa]